MKLVLKSKMCLAVAVIANLSACASTPKLGGDPSLQVTSMSGLPAPRAADVVQNNALYSVGPYDKLSIEVIGIPELSVKEIQVDANGSISVPLAGPVNVSGMTSLQIGQYIANKLRDSYVRDPKVTVNLIETVSHVITVDGKVKRPGVYPVAGGMTLMRSVALAEGIGNDARLNDVVVFRTVDGQRYAALYNLAAIRRGRYPDPAIYANDIIMVGDNASNRLFRDLLTGVPAILTPIIILLTQS
jgi:polysaccharide export outer membrane protein